MRLSLPLVLLLTGCAPSLVLPPTAVPAGEWDQTLETAVAVPNATPGSPVVRTDYDTASGYTRRLVTTHPGTYTGWVQKPQISFFAMTRGADRPHKMPASIGLIFRTLEPDAVTGPRLILGCPSLTDTVNLANASHVAPTGNTHSHFLTYLLPTERVAAFAGCSEGTLQVGQTAARFERDQLGGLRALLLELGAAHTPGDT